jgi:hypothetical protein
MERPGGEEGARQDRDTGEGPRLTLHGNRVTGNVRKVVLEEMMEARMKGWLQSKNGHKEANWGVMDAVAAQAGMGQPSSLANRVAVTKYVAGWMATQEVAGQATGQG